MNPQVASIVYAVLILGLFWLDRESRRASWTLWIPTFWLLIIGSRPVSVWLAPGATVDATSLEGSPLDAIVFAALLLGAFGVLILRGTRSSQVLRANAPVLLFFLYCGISVLWSDYSFVAFKRWTKAIGDVAVILVMVTDSTPTVAIQRVLSRVGFILLPLSILFIKYFPDIGRSYNPWTGTAFYGGVTLFKNQLGEICLVAGLASVWTLVFAYREYKGKTRLRHMGAHAVIALMAVWLFLTADSMTSFSCFVFGSTVIVATNFRFVRRSPSMVHALAIGLIVLAACAVFLPGANLVQSVGRDSTLTGRTAIWAAALAQVEHPLIGTGFESFWTGDRLLRIWDLINEPGIQEAHDGYLEAYLNLGWIGVTLLGLLIIGGYRSVMATFRQARKLGTIRLALFVAGVIFSFTEAGFRMLSPMWFAFLIASIAVPIRKLHKQQDRPNRGLSVRKSSEIAVGYEDALKSI